MRKILLDVETTGLDPFSGHKIIEIGCVEVVNKLRTGRVFHKYINPKRDVPHDAFKIHGISTKFLQDKPNFSDIATDLLDFLDTSELIIHNAPFDLKFINYELDAIKLGSLKNQVIDTLSIARNKFPGLPASLNALCKRFNINLEERNSKGHGALLDSELLYHVYICLVEGVQSELSVREKVEEKTIASNREKIIPRIFEYQEDYEKHKKFIESIKNSLWTKD